MSGVPSISTIHSKLSQGSFVIVFLFGIITIYIKYYLKILQKKNLLKDFTHI